MALQLQLNVKYYIRFKRDQLISSAVDNFYWLITPYFYLYVLSLHTIALILGDFSLHIRTSICLHGGTLVEAVT
jgi:hypothetical protein